MTPRSEQAEEERPVGHALSSGSQLAPRGVGEEEEEEGDDEEEEEGSPTEKSQDEAPESPSPVAVTAGAYEEEEEDDDEGADAAPLAMSYEHTRRYAHTCAAGRRFIGHMRVAAYFNVTNTAANH